MTTTPATLEDGLEGSIFLGSARNKQPFCGGHLFPPQEGVAPGYVPGEPQSPGFLRQNGARALRVLHFFSTANLARYVYEHEHVYVYVCKMCICIAM